MKKTFLGILASLMVAGAISAASGLSAPNSAADVVVIVGDGTSPLLVSPHAPDVVGDVMSQNK